MPRPQRVETCQTCGLARGGGYPTCPECYAAAEVFWRADWESLLQAEGIAAGSEDERLLADVVLAEMDQHPWTVVDTAMTLVRCRSCGAELGGGPSDCFECQLAFGNAIAYDIPAGEQGVMTANEHALRIGRHILRAPHQHSPNILTAWRLTFPRLLTGWLPTTEEAQRGMALVKAGKTEAFEAAMRRVDAMINRSAQP
ncbi:MAG: hypothetical protein KIT87_16030 [Anaerolineae bacterium]|nr:hypothetical protein [Anaerolineae bacterium]